MECDVQVSSDGGPFVFHDDTLDRLTAEQGPVRSRSADMLDRVLLKGTEESPPRLSTLLEQIGGGAPPLGEIKAPGRHIIPLCFALRRAAGGYRGEGAGMSRFEEETSEIPSPQRPPYSAFFFKK